MQSFLKAVDLILTWFITTHFYKKIIEPIIVRQKKKATNDHFLDALLKENSCKTTTKLLI